MGWGEPTVKVLSAEVVQSVELTQRTDVRVARRDRAPLPLYDARLRGGEDVDGPLPRPARRVARPQEFPTGPAPQDS